MPRPQTVGEILARVHERQRAKRCPHCVAPVSVTGFAGRHRWACTECEAIGIGYTSRTAALEDIERRRS